MRRPLIRETLGSNWTRRVLIVLGRQVVLCLEQPGTWVTR